MAPLKIKAPLEVSELAYLSPQQFLKLCRVRDLFIVTGKFCPQIPPWLSDDTIDMLCLLEYTHNSHYFMIIIFFWLWELPGHRSAVLRGSRALGIRQWWGRVIWGCTGSRAQCLAAGLHSWGSVRRLSSLSIRSLQLQRTSDTDQTVECHRQGSWFIKWSSFYTVF